MKKTAWLAALLFIFLRFACWAQTFKVYPRAKLDEKSTTEANKSPMNKGMDVKVYATPDAFEKVRTFYASLYYETRGGNPPRVPNGPEIHWAFFTIDDAKNLWTSKYWVKCRGRTLGIVPENLCPTSMMFVMRLLLRWCRRSEHTLLTSKSHAPCRPS